MKILQEHQWFIYQMECSRQKGAFLSRFTNSTAVTMTEDSLDCLHMATGRLKPHWHILLPETKGEQNIKMGGRVFSGTLTITSWPSEAKWASWPEDANAKELVQDRAMWSQTQVQDLCRSSWNRETWQKPQCRCGHPYQGHSEGWRGHRRGQWRKGSERHHYGIGKSKHQQRTPPVKQSPVLGKVSPKLPICLWNFISYAVLPLVAYEIILVWSNR